MNTTRDIMKEARRISLELSAKMFKPMEVLMILESARAATLSFLANDSQDVYKKAEEQAAAEEN